MIPSTIQSFTHIAWIKSPFCFFILDQHSSFKLSQVNLSQILLLHMFTILGKYSTLGVMSYISHVSLPRHHLEVQTHGHEMTPLSNKIMWEIYLDNDKKWRRRLKSIKHSPLTIFINVGQYASKDEQATSTRIQKSQCSRTYITY